MQKISRWIDRVSHLNGRPRDFAQLDLQRIADLAVQLDGDRMQPQKVTRKFGLSLSGPSIELGSELGHRQSPIPLRVDELLRSLEKNDMLSYTRPATAPKRGGNSIQYVLEKMTATPVILPVSGFPNEQGVKSLKVWVSDPNPFHLDGPDWSFRGSFLFLTEIVFEDGPYNSVYSGCSALRFIVNASQNKFLLEHSGPDFFGRESSNHPIQKLSDIGGVVGDSRDIESLYRIRYMTDEQVYVYDESEHRVHDIVGYPLFISW